jgi:hypothetical protein
MEMILPLYSAPEKSFSIKGLFLISARREMRVAGHVFRAHMLRCVCPELVHHVTYCDANSVAAI